jgi:hypothetical protein
LSLVLGIVVGFSSFGDCSASGEAQEGEWKERKCQHFVFYYKKAPEGFVKSVEETAEYYYEEIARNLGFTRYESWSWDDRARIYIYDNADDYVEAGKQARWSHGVASPRGKIIRTFPAAHGFFDSTLPHELGHIIFREFIGLEPRVPAWFEEGVAMYQEKARRWGAHEAVRQAMKEKTFMSLEEMTQMRLSATMNADRVQLFYAESASIINYLMEEFGKHRFVNLCRKIQEGRPFEGAVSSVYGQFKNMEKLNQAWVRYLQQ